MAIRTTEAQVREIIEVDDLEIKISPFITYASTLVDAIEAKADADTELTVSAAQLLMIETYLAAHFLAIRDPRYQEHKTGQASGKVFGTTGMALDSTPWGQMAKVADPTGYLEGGGKFAKGFWLGTTIT